MLAHFFYKIPLPKTLPNEIEKEVRILKRIKKKDLVLQKAYQILITKFQGAFSFENLQDHFTKGLKSLWHVKRQHCTAMNYFLRILLVKSGHFREKDIRLKYSFFIISPHQYLDIKTKNGWFNMDPWTGTKGLKLGDHGYGLHWRG
ncbi:hypothetical protein EXS74_01785 [Candidatus Woesearchaeota archaeon]|nr:hypothetical protein [Candidatus Woesearchaeota archaeon]